MCGGIKSKMILDKDRFGLPFKMFSCLRCGLFYTSPRISQESLPIYYDEIYHPLIFGTEYVKDDLVDKNQGELVFEYISHHINKNTDAEFRILDIGCADGGILQFHNRKLLNQKIKVDLYGIEYSKKYYEESKNKGIEVIQGGVDKISSFGVKFNLIIMSHVLEHMVNIKSDIEYVKNALNNNGILYVEVPGLYNMISGNKYEFSLKNYFVHAHNYHFCLKTLRNFFEEQGLYLVSGNEKVQAVFVKIPDKSYDKNIKEYDIFQYLFDIEKISDFICKEKEKRNLAINQRNKAIRDKKTKIESIYNSYTWKIGHFIVRFIKHLDFTVILNIFNRHR